MRTDIKILSLILLLTFAIVCCKENAKEERQLAFKEYGELGFVSDSFSVELKINEFKDFKELFDRAERIVCNDSIPKITLKKDKEIKTVFFLNPCWEDVGCILIREKNTFKIHNDTIFKAGKIYPLESLTSLLRKDIENKGKDPRFSASPEKLLIFLSYNSNNGIENLPNTLDLLVESYEKVTNKRDIKIWLDERTQLPPFQSQIE